MNWWNPAVERRLKEAVLRALAIERESGRGGKLQRSRGDFRKVTALAGFLAMQVFWTLAMLSFLGWHQPELASWDCQLVVVGWWFLFSGGLVGNLLQFHSFASPEARMLWTLPAAGGRILRWSRARALWRTWPILLRACVACWWLGGASEALELTEVLSWLVPGVVMGMLTVAWPFVEASDWMCRVKLDRVWHWLRMGTIPGLVILWLSVEHGWFWLPMVEWLERLSPWLVWLMPASWVAGMLQPHTTAFGWWGMLLTMVVVLVGFRGWLRWPMTAAPAFDELWPDHDAEDLEAQAEKAEAVPDRALMKEQLRGGEAARLLEAGWIERWVLSWLNARDRAVFAVLVMVPPNWSQRWRKAALGSLGLAVMLAAVQLLSHQIPQEYVEMFFVWGGMMGAGLLLVLVMPWSGGVSDAVMAWPAGIKNIPFLAGFPVGAWDLLRISVKIVLVRSIATMLLLPLGVIMVWWLKDGATALITASVGLRVLLLLMAVRPLLVMHRMSTVMKCHRGGWVALGTYIFAAVVTLILALVMLVCAAALLGFSGVMDGKGWLISGGLLVVFLLAGLGVFGCHQWRLRGRQVDYEAQ